MNFFFTLRIWMTDRYLFFPTIGSCLALVALAAPLARRRAQAGRKQGGGRALAWAALLAIAIYSAMTVARIGIWTNSVSLWSDVLRKDLGLPGSGPVTAGELRGARNLELVVNGPLMGLVHAYMWAGNRAEADAIGRLVGGSAGAGTEDNEMTLAQQAFDEGRLDEALARFRTLAQGKTWLAPLATIWTGVVEKRMGDEEASRRSIQRGIDLYHQTGQPATEGLLVAGTAAFRRGEFAQAVEWYRLAQQESPREAKTAFHLGRALEESGDVKGAMEQYRRIAGGELPLLPDSQFTILDVYLQMAVAAQKLGQRQEAIGYFEEVLKRAPDHPKRDAIRAQIATLRAGAGATP
jgi:tetratricopeptide (TPR) repeat protein